METGKDTIQDKQIATQTIADIDFFKTDINLSSIFKSNILIIQHIFMR